MNRDLKELAEYIIDQLSKRIELPQKEVLTLEEAAIF